MFIIVTFGALILFQNENWSLNLGRHRKDEWNINLGQREYVLFLIIDNVEISVLKIVKVGLRI